MEKKPLLKRILSVSLAAAVTVNGLTFSALAEDTGAINFKEVSNNSVSAELSDKKLDTDSGTSPYTDTDVVRVSIVLKDKPTIENTVEMGYDIENIAENSAAMSYRSVLQDKQANLVNEIEKVTKEDLDVVWNLTLAANIISANVEYGQIEAIEALEEVEEVLIETQYYPDVIKDTLPLDPNMATSSEQIGSQLAWDSGYTGAGSRIAIIDTGTDDDHQSFSEAGYLHSLDELAKAKGVSYDEYVKSLNLLTWDEISSVKDQLNAGTAYNGQSSVLPITEQVYLNAKLPFAYNYVDSDYDTNHDNDTQGEHGSHVAGIATANKYIKLADGSFVKALDYSMALTQGVAPDAQLITMKVFGKGGGAYDSDYMVAIEDAIVLKADSINLSLGSGNPGASKSATKKYQEIFNNLSKSGVVVSISSGNAGYWAENLMYGLPYLYSDDVSMQTDGAPGSFTNALTVASVDNAGTTGTYLQVGDEKIFYNESPTTYDSIVSLAGKPVEYVFTDGFGTQEEWAALGDALKGRIAVCSRGNGVSFVDKANWAIEAGAIATIVYNNAAGTINMSADGYNYPNPYVSITKEAGDILRAYAVANGTPVAPAAAETEAVTEAAEAAEETTEATEAAESADAAQTVETTEAAAAETTAADEISEPSESSGETETSAETEAPETTETSAETEAPAVPAADAAPAGYVASMTVSKDFTFVGPEEPLTNQQTMSSFSSWGIPGSLELKPEITAPGGNIYSVNGLIPGGTAYENMSGTSMAAPQIAGMSALAAQYVRENKLADKTGLTPRVLIQSLLMSTATPLVDEDSATYPVIQQGAGLANINDAISADSYILMDADATDSYKDGKVKVELGDDPDMKGEYTFSFTINSLSDTDKNFVLDAEMFTQMPAPSDGDYYMFTSTIPMDFTASYSVNGTAASTVTVPAGGSVKVTATVKLDLSSALMQQLLAIYDKGMYVEGYVYAIGYDDAEGVVGTVHSIPVLGFLGNWSDPSMFDVGSYIEYLSEEEDRVPYFGSAAENVFGIEYASDPGSAYYMGGNPVTNDDVYMPERNAINGNDVISLVQFSPIRNAANSRFAIINEANPEGSVAVEAGAVNAAYFHDNQGAWMGTVNTLNIGASLGSLGFKEGDKATVLFTLVPEYYVDDSGETVVTAWDKLGEGASFGLSMTVDNTKPSISRMSLENETVLKVTASDNQYVAGVVLYNKTGDVIINLTGSNPDAAVNQSGDFYIPVDGVKGSQFLIQVYDYANNVSTYSFNQEIGMNLPLPHALALNYNSRTDSTIWAELVYDEAGIAGAAGYAGCAANFTAATNADHYIFAVDEDGVLYVMPEDDIYNYVKVADLGVAINDLAYNPVDRQIYGVTGSSELVRIDKLSGEVTFIDAIPNTVALACDKNGYFYGNLYGTGVLYGFTLDDIENPVGIINIDSSLELGVSNGAQGLEVDPNTNHVCWYANTVAGTDTDRTNNFTFLEFDIDMEAGAVSLYDAARFNNTRLFGLVFVDERPVKNYDFNGDGTVSAEDGQALLDYRTGKLKELSNIENIDVDEDGDFDTHDAYVLFNTVLWARPTSETNRITISNSDVLMVTNGTYQLEANVTPWTAVNRNVVWYTSDPAVAAVDSNGLVTANSAGSCVISAVSAANGRVYVQCNVTVENVEATLYGALQDVNGDPTFYEWNVAEDDTWTPTVAIDRFGSDISAAAIDDEGFVYISDGNGNIHKFDPASGSELDSAAFGLPLGDMAYSYTESTAGAPMFASIYQAWILAPADPMAFTGSGFNLTSYVNNYGASKFIALTSGGASQAETEDGVITGEEFVAIDDAGNVWDFLFTDETIYWNTYRSVLPAGFLGTNGRGEYCSLAYGTDGYMYLAVYDGNTANLYRIALKNDTASASYFGNVGDGVWPATILSATANASTAVAAYADDVKVMNNEASVSNAANALAETEEDTAEAESASDSIENAYAGKLGANASTAFGASTEELDASLDSSIALFAEGDEAADETVSNAVISGGQVNVELKSHVNNEPVESTNGLFVVKYSPKAMSFANAVSADGVYNSYNVDEENGVLVIAFASSLFMIPEDEPDQIVNFDIIDEELVKEGAIQVVQLESDEKNNTAVPKTDEEGNIVVDEGGNVVYEAPVNVIDPSTANEAVDTIVEANPELSENIKAEDDPTEEPSKPTNPGSNGGGTGGFVYPDETTVPDETSAPEETTAPAETTASADDNNNGSENGGNTGSSSETGTVTDTADQPNSGDVSVDTTAPTDSGSSDNGNVDSSDNGNGDVGNAGEGDDKNMNTGVLLFVAPAAVSAIAVLVSRKKRK